MRVRCIEEDHRLQRMVVRDRDWQSFLRTPECRRHTVEAVTRLCRWWFLRGMVEDLRRERRKRRLR